MKPLFKEIPYLSPATYFRPFAEQDGALFLDSSLPHHEWGRYSYIALSPWSMITAKNQELLIDGRRQSSQTPFDLLTLLHQKFKLETIDELPPFQGGMAGLFGYELYQHLENIAVPQRDDLQVPDLILGLYDLVISFDHHQQKAWILSSGLPELEDTARQVRAQERLDWIACKLSSITEDAALNWKSQTVESPQEAAVYAPQVQKVIDYIYAGDIYQANLSHRFKATLQGLSPWQLYERLRTINPAPFSAYLKYQNWVVASASPERYIKVEKGIVETKPIKGTRKCDADPTKDAAIAAELLCSEKDRSENIMIVDLLRNDLSRVCKPHSVKVTKLLALESYATVHHLVTTIQGELENGNSLIDLLRVTFPGGSITGAPKIRAMEIINEIEQQQRGPYCGSIGFIGFNGAMDTNILIRSYTIKDNLVNFNVGGGIVADSDPLDEYEETLTKAAALRRALTS